MFAGFNWQQMISAFIVLFAVIDIIGSIPIIINLNTPLSLISIPIPSNIQQIQLITSKTTFF